MARKIVDSKLFHAVKIMIAGGATAVEIKEYFGISENTVTRIRAVENFTEYKQQLAAIALQNAEYKARAKAKAKVEPVQVEPAHVKPVQDEPAKAQEPVKVVPTPTAYMPYATQQELLRLLREQNEMLKIISNKLVFIVEQLA